MKFDRLKASIANNASQKPNLYMALCMVESLFEDMEDEAGRELGQCPAGDETLPTRLAWLCRTVNGIYREKSDELTRNRSRLDAAMAKLGETERELNELSAVAERLSAAQAESCRLQAKLLEAQRAQKEHAALAEECARMKETLHELQSFDAGAAQRQLSESKAEIARLTQEKAELLAQQASGKQKLAQVQNDLCGLQEENEACRKQLEALEQQQRQSEQDAITLRGSLQSLSAEERERTKELELLRAERDAANRSIAGLTAKISAFRSGELNSAQSELELQKQELAALMEEKGMTDAALSGFIAERDSLTLEIARSKQEQEQAAEELKKKRILLQNLSAEKQNMLKELNGISQALGSLQDEVEQLRTSRLPELHNLHGQEEKRRQELQTQVDGLSEQMDLLAADILAMEAQLPELEEKLSTYKASYDGLTARHTAKSKELEDLERRVQELRDKNEEEKLELYRKQLETNYQDLLEIQKKCKDLSQENETYRVSLAYEREKYNGLVADKKTYEATQKELAELLKQMSPFATDEYQLKIRTISQRLTVLESVREKLAKAITQMGMALGKKPFSELIPLDDRLKTQLRDLQNCTEDLYKEVRSCANSLKLEEQ